MKKQFQKSRFFVLLVILLGAIFVMPKAQAMMLNPDTAYSYVWGGGGDGELTQFGTWWDTTSNFANLMNTESDDFDSFFSFPIPTEISDENNAKTVDEVNLVIKVVLDENEGAEIVRIKALDTNDKCGYGTDHAADEIARDGAGTLPRKSGEMDTTGLNSLGWKWVGVPVAWLSPGDSGYLTLYLYPYSGWEIGNDDQLAFNTKDSGSGPYLEIKYTTWSAPTANSEDIAGEPSELLPGQNYTVQTIVSDADGRTNLNDAFLYISEDHVSNRVRFDWDRATDTFSQGEGVSYSVLNISGCSSVEYEANGYQLTWKFNITLDWQEGFMDWANSATDMQSKTTTNWNDENSWYTNRLWVYSISVYWIRLNTYLEDWSSVMIFEDLNITGYVYWYNTNTSYDLGFGTPLAKLYVDGIDQGSVYNCSLNAEGYYNISYFTPETKDMDWALDIQLGNIPSGMDEGPSQDDGKKPLFLTSIPFSGELGLDFSVMIQPAPIIPSKLTSYVIYASGATQIGGYGFRAMETNNDEYYKIDIDTGNVFVGLDFESNYWNQSDMLIYDISTDTGEIRLYDFHPNRTLIEKQIGGDLTITGTHAIEEKNWFNGFLATYVFATVKKASVDQLIINFTASTQIYTGERVWNGTEYLEMLRIPVLEPNTNITIYGVPPQYNLVKVLPNCSYSFVEDTLTLYNTAPTIYEIVFSTSFTRPDLVTIVLNYYSSITNEPFPANTLNSSYVIDDKEYRIEPYTSKFIWDKDNGDPFIRSYDYFGRLLVNQSFTIPDISVFYVIDVGLQLHRLTVHCNTMATLNITNSLNESYFPTFEVSPENATLIKTLWLYGENVTVTTHSNDYGDITHVLDISKISFVNFKYRIPVLWKGEREMPRGKSALLSMIEFIFKWLGIAFIGYLAQHYWRKYRLAEKIDKHIL